jgi:NAD+ synthase (glutamine-hydrolysing)
MNASGPRIALAQFNPLVGDLQGNVQRMLQWCADAAQQNAQLIVFPELSLTGYPPEDLLLRPGFLRAAEQALQDFQHGLAECGGIEAVVGHPQINLPDKPFNMASWLSADGVVARYAKQRLPNYGVFDEQRYFSAGRDACVVERWGVRFALSVCEDLWHPDSCAQAAAAGGEWLLNLNASPYHQGKHAERLQVAQRRQQETGMGLVYVNQVGGQDELVFDGRSFVLPPNTASPVVSLQHAEEQLTIINLAELPKDSPVANPVDGDALAELYAVLVLAVRDYVQKNGFPGALLGLSGGIDSALTLALAVDALGPDKVAAIAMPSRYTAPISLDDAAQQAQRLGVEYQILPIEPVFQSFLQTLAEPFAGCAVDATEENVQARCRGVLLMALSNKTGRMLLTTGNKSEMSVGYATLYGDMAGGFAPLKDVFKTTVYALARWRNAQALAQGETEIIPSRVIERAPSAELAPDQLDSDSLPPYDVLDALLAAYIEQDHCPEEITAAGFAPEIVERVVRMVDRNEYKRRQAPPGVRISSRAFGRDRRYPITSGYDRHRLARNRKLDS